MFRTVTRPPGARGVDVYWMFIYQRRVPPLRTSSHTIMNLFLKNTSNMLQSISMKKSEKHTTHLPKNLFAEGFGWVGSITILAAYALLSFGIVNSNAPIYHVLFLTGSAGLAVVTYRHRAYQSFIVNIFFTTLALIALIRVIYFV